MGGLRETFRGMMVASSRPWFVKAMATIDPLMGAEQRNNKFDRSTKSQLIFRPQPIPPLGTLLQVTIFVFPSEAELAKKELGF